MPRVRRRLLLRQRCLLVAQRAAAPEAVPRRPAVPEAALPRPVVPAVAHHHHQHQQQWTRATSGHRRSVRMTRCSRNGYV